VCVCLLRSGSNLSEGKDYVPEPLSLVHTYVQCPRTVRVHGRQTVYAYCQRTYRIQCFGSTPNLACPINQTKSRSEAAAGMCAGYTFVMGRKKQPKYAKRFWTRRLFNNVVQHGQNLLRELHVQDGSRFRKFVSMTKGDFEILLQKIDPRIQRKDTNRTGIRTRISGQFNP
jgi:hypothetical protein